MINKTVARNFDLEERTAKFAEAVIDLTRKLSQEAVNVRLIEQAVGSAGSLGANYCEANEAESKRDFQHKISICKKEIKECRYWLRLLARANPNYKEELPVLWRESQELLLIFSKILKSSKSKV